MKVNLLTGYNKSSVDEATNLTYIFFGYKSIPISKQMK